MLKGTYFITATDTEVGKTFVSCYLLKKQQAQGDHTLGLKPVAAGSEKGINEDAVLLKNASSINLSLKHINPFCFKDACSPHIAAAMEGVELRAENVVEALQYPLSMSYDLCLIEGAGGWYAPLSDSETWRDIVRLLNVPVIFVVGMKLGCLNHALLTERALLHDGVEIKGWIANSLSKSMFQYDENLRTLKQNLTSPLLEIIEFQG